MTAPVYLHTNYPHSDQPTPYQTSNGSKENHRGREECNENGQPAEAEKVVIQLQSKSGIDNEPCSPICGPFMCPPEGSADSLLENRVPSPSPPVDRTHVIEGDISELNCEQPLDTISPNMPAFEDEYED